jgi:hypothetical protein
LPKSGTEVKEKICTKRTLALMCRFGVPPKLHVRT